MTIARIENGAVAEYRELSLADIPEHKRGMWRTVVEEGSGPTVTAIVEEAQVRRVRSWTVAQRQDAINSERDRRLRAFPFAGKLFGFTEVSRIDIAGAGSLAQGAIMAGAQPGDLRWADPDTDFRWVAEDNSSVSMDAQTCFAFAQAGARWRSDHIHAARALKDANPIPENYTDDQHWPT